MPHALATNQLWDALLWCCTAVKEARLTNRWTYGMFRTCSQCVEYAQVKHLSHLFFVQKAHCCHCRKTRAQGHIMWDEFWLLRKVSTACVIVFTSWCEVSHYFVKVSIFPFHIVALSLLLTFHVVVWWSLSNAFKLSYFFMTSHFFCCFFVIIIISWCCLVHLVMQLLYTASALNVKCSFSCQETSSHYWEEKTKKIMWNKNLRNKGWICQMV